MTVYYDRPDIIYLSRSTHDTCPVSFVTIAKSDTKMPSQNKCSNCGAPVNQVTCRCDYCGTYYGI